MKISDCSPYLCSLCINNYIIKTAYLYSSFLYYLIVFQWFSIIKEINCKYDNLVTKAIRQNNALFYLLFRCYVLQYLNDLSGCFGNGKCSGIYFFESVSVFRVVEDNELFP